MTAAMQIYDFLCHTVFLYIYLLSIYLKLIECALNKKRMAMGKFAAKMNLANAIHHAGCFFKLLCVRMVGVPTLTILTRLSLSGQS